jgi:hypothetical protein
MNAFRCTGIVPDAHRPHKETARQPWNLRGGEIFRGGPLANAGRRR